MFGIEIEELTHIITCHPKTTTYFHLSSFSQSLIFPLVLKIPQSYMQICNFKLSHTIIFHFQVFRQPRKERRLNQTLCFGRKCFEFWWFCFSPPLCRRDDTLLDGPMRPPTPTPFVPPWLSSFPLSSSSSLAKAPFSLLVWLAI